MHRRLSSFKWSVLAAIYVGAGCSARSTVDENVGSSMHETPASAQARGAAKHDTSDGGLADRVAMHRQTVLFWVDAVSDRIWRANVESDGSDRRLVASGPSAVAPAGIAVDAAEGFVYWTNAGTSTSAAGADDASGSVQRMKLDGESVETVVPFGSTSTPNQITIDEQGRKLYWSDRDAMVWRAELDGSAPEVLLRGNDLQQPAGIGIDVAQRKIYISDRIARRLYRVGFDMPEGENAETRSDVEIIAMLPAPAWPLHLAVDHEARKIYWTDRARGAIYAMNMDIPADVAEDSKPVVSDLIEPVAIAIDEVTKRLYFTELSGRVSRSNLDGSERETILTSGSASAIALAHLPN